MTALWAGRWSSLPGNAERERERVVLGGEVQKLPCPGLVVQQRDE